MTLGCEFETLYVNTIFFGMLLRSWRGKVVVFSFQSEEEHVKRCVRGFRENAQVVFVTKATFTEAVRKRSPDYFFSAYDTVIDLLPERVGQWVFKPEMCKSSQTLEK